MNASWNLKIWGALSWNDNFVEVPSISPPPPSSPPLLPLLPSMSMPVRLRESTRRVGIVNDTVKKESSVVSLLERVLCLLPRKPHQ